jgi:hypothetical protein
MYTINHYYFQQTGHDGARRHEAKNSPSLNLRNSVIAYSLTEHHRPPWRRPCQVKARECGETEP